MMELCRSDSESLTLRGDGLWRNIVPFSYTYLPCSLWERQDSTQRQLLPIRKFMRRAPAETFCAASPLHFRENTWRSPSTSRETPTVALSIAVSQSARSFHHRDRRNKFPIFLPFFSLFHPLHPCAAAAALSSFGKGKRSLLRRRK